MSGDTELRLLFWRDGSTQAERLAAEVLRLAGYNRIDPQSPLGGPDGKKDILCQKGAITWVAAVYFATGPKKFTEIKKKYLADLQGMPDEYVGFVFVTNQNLTPKNRNTLAELAQSESKEADFIHLQSLVTALDSAQGYGARIQFLKIPMTIEEQLSWVVDSDQRTELTLAANTRELRALRATIERMNVTQTEIARTAGLPITGGVSTPDLISVSDFTKNDNYSSITEYISPQLIILFHRLSCYDLPTRLIGALRTQEVTIGDGRGRTLEHMQPPAPELIQEQLSQICDYWNDERGRAQNKASKLEIVARFHSEFLTLHPFLDGNGRTARALLMQQCLDLFGKANMSLLNKGADYYAALRDADSGNTESLRSLLDPVIS